MADRILWAMRVLIVVGLLGAVVISARQSADAMPPLPTRTVLSDRDIQMIVAPSGTPIVLYDPARKRLMIVVGSLPRGTDVCINKRCLLDTSWTTLADDPRR